LKDLWEARQNLPKKWKDLGPDNLGGRVTCLIAKSGSDGNNLLAGAACGGVWDGTVTGPNSNLHCEWEANPAKPKNRHDETFLMHNIGSLAISGQTIYCGTGHAYYSGDSFPGVGLFRSEDNGKTWTKAGNDFPKRISTIAIDDKNVWIGGVVLPGEQEDESDGAEHSGVFYSANKGETWRRETFHLDEEFSRRFAVSLDDEAGIFEDRDYQCHSIVFLENGAKVILAAITAPLGWGGIWRSRNGGKLWEQLTRGLPSPREFGRTSLAVAKTKRNQNVVYAFIGAADGRCLGVYRSCDGGDHWVGRGTEHFAAVSGLNYVNCLAVSPADPDIVVCGARDLHRSIDGGQTWTQVTEWFAAPDSRGYSHADHHALLWPERERLYSANDGGVDVSHDNGITWRNLTDGLGVAMFYDIDVAASFGSKNSPNLIIAGGTQDNASVITNFRALGIGYVPTCTGLQLGLSQSMAGGAATQHKTEEEVIVNFDGSGISGLVTGPGVQLIPIPVGNAGANAKPARNFIETLYGDGGWTVFDPGDPLHVYGSSQNMAIYRHRRDNGWQVVTPEDASDEERNRIWMAIIAMHPTDPNTVFTGSTRVWRTNNDGMNWVAVSDDLDGSPITAIEIADNDPNFIYVGTENGNIFKSRDGGNRWNDELGEDRPKPMEWRKDFEERLTIGVARTITRIEAHPNNANKIAVTLMGFDQKYRLPHVLWFDGDTNEHEKKKSKSEKTEWIDLSDAHLGDDAPLPNVQYNVVTWDKEGDYLFVGNDIGVWALKTRGDTFEKDAKKYCWRDISSGLPNALVTDLVYHSRSHSLTAATYGRSLWWAAEEAWTR
jgi:photosystem II stability/assembly factor-like uncharacterized protein